MAENDGDALDYVTAIISTQPIPQEDLVRARDFAREQGWITAP